ncbi:cupin domain-containing protein [Leucobacter chinensis]|uniref:cupin domain-containing protein n=1 Tax=Leucobacter chinensis TaxID=2851010 RepID=UPI001C21080E|nr:cupin domain-containing protein [Leucobacter chinensis]
MLNEYRLEAGAAVNLTELPLRFEVLPGNEVREGAPATGLCEIDAGPGLDIGVWHMTEGTAVDVEEDECFVVLTGRATVMIEAGDSGEARTLELAPGTLGRLVAGMKTVWIVHESLRKLYLSPVA